MAGCCIKEALLVALGCRIEPYSGNLMLRIPAEIHAAVASAAESSGKSINQWAASVLDKASDAH
ncbi:MAG: toxin-antitoxin system HicB family antitoxin [Desulfotignum sp.]|nr:toxin-antitoxin system HicB family antitoxin [Desulfotignum sp.]